MRFRSRTCALAKSDVMVTPDMHCVDGQFDDASSADSWPGCHPARAGSGTELVSANGSQSSHDFHAKQISEAPTSFSTSSHVPIDGAYVVADVPLKIFESCENRAKPTTKAPTHEIENPQFSDQDVLCGRGGATNNHPGNRYFRKLVQESREEYFLAKKTIKGQISLRIVATICAQGGRFLKKNKCNGEWCDIGEKQATAKTSQALREGLEVKKRRAFMVSQGAAEYSESTQPGTPYFKPQKQPKVEMT
uniref:DUF6824 domain-containing protein n=1 Tax=Trieres chinensis TaxID=1514140 RepID=A0A7S2A7E7_TRICV|mmetsp:Transcript_5552/g.11565  ORF Transcript_5552/g.11565 Transcript_5552/m.11565 type:complete len:249 (+) Transcript_5552:88-834(+)